MRLTVDRAKTQRQAWADDEVRDHRLGEVRHIVEDFIYCLAQLLAGHDAVFDGCATREVASRLTNAVTPFLDSGAMLRPNFGAFGELRVDGDLLDTSKPISASVEFDDRSFLLLQDGRLEPVRRKRMRLVLRMTLQPCTVIDCRVEINAP